MPISNQRAGSCILNDNGYMPVQSLGGTAIYLFKVILLSLFFVTTLSANTINSWLEIENSNFPPHKKIELSNALLKQHKSDGSLDGQLKGYIQLASIYQSLEKLDKANNYLSLATDINERVNSRSEKVRINNLQTILFAMKGKIKKAEALIVANLAESELISDELLLADTLMQYAYIMQIKTQFADSIEALYKAQIIFEKLKDKRRVMSAQSYLAIIYAKLKNFSKAIEYYEHAIHFAKELQDDFSLSIFYYNLGTAYLGEENWQKAINNFSKARELSLSLDDKAGVAFATAQLGNVMVKNDQYQQALPLLLDAYDTSKNVISRFMHLNIQVNIAVSYAKLGNKSLARRYIAGVDIISFGEDIRFPYMLLAIAYAELGDYEKSSSLFLEHIKRLNKASEKNKKQSIQRLEVIYDVRFEKSRNELLRHENLLKQAELKDQNQYRLIILLTLVLVLVILGGTFRHIRIQKKHKQMFKDLAFKDELTEIANRRGILDFASLAYQTSVENKSPLILGIIDLDHFKQVNDTYGHDIGDQVLRYFAKNATACLCNTEKVGRYGGEEWLLVLPGLSKSEVESKFNLLSKSYQESKPEMLPKGLMLSFSMGAVIVNPNIDSSVKELLKQADVALYKAKVGGRARYEIAE